MAKLTREAGFGSVSIQSTFCIHAGNRTEALARALARLAESHPGYSCATIRADEAPAG